MSSKSNKPSPIQLLIECFEHSSTASNLEFSIPATLPLNFAHCTISLPSVLLRDSGNRTGSRYQYIIWHLQKSAEVIREHDENFFFLFWASIDDGKKSSTLGWPRKFQCLPLNARLLGVKFFVSWNVKVYRKPFGIGMYGTWKLVDNQFEGFFCQLMINSNRVPRWQWVWCNDDRIYCRTGTETIMGNFPFVRLMRIWVVRESFPLQSNK